MELIKITGNPYERGYKFGERLKNKIKACIEFENNFWSARVTPEQTKRSFEENIGVFESFAPEILEEIRGLAEGAGLKHEQFLNSAISSPYFSPMFCSAFIALSSLTKNKEPIMGRNVDWSSESKIHIRYTLTKPSNGYNHICSRDLDSVGYYDGMNERGLAIGWAGVFTPKSEVAPGLSMFFITKLVLERCSSAKEAIRLIENVPIANAANFIILDKNGAAVIETTSKHRIIRTPKKSKRENFLIITNNFTSPKMKKYDVIYKKWPEAADPRIKRYNELIKENAGSIDVKITKKILSDHEGSICAHDKDEGQGQETISSFIALPKSKSPFYANGAPCKNKYFNFEV